MRNATASFADSEGAVPANLSNNLSSVAGRRLAEVPYLCFAVGSAQRLVSDARTVKVCLPQSVVRRSRRKQTR